MVFVKVRETYDLHTIKNKMTVISIHTPKPRILIDNFPGLLMQCKAYRPVSCDIKVACASVLPLDPLGVGTATGDVSPEDVFNPILYKTITNVGMSQLEARIQALQNTAAGTVDLRGPSADVDVDSLTNASDEFPIYYGLLSNAHEWKHANPQAGLAMTNVKPFVYEILYNMADAVSGAVSGEYGPLYPEANGSPSSSAIPTQQIRGNAKPFPFINCVSYGSNGTLPGFPQTDPATVPINAMTNVNYMDVVCAAIIVPPSKLHEMFYRMVIEWTIEFSSIRPIGEITTWAGLANIGNLTHLQNYSYTTTKEALTGDSSTILSDDKNMVSANVEIDKVM